MRRLAPGCQIVRPDGRRMQIQAVQETDGILIIWWRQISAGEKAAA